MNAPRIHRDDETVITNALGGSQSKIDETPSLIPGEAFLALQTAFEGERTNWFGTAIETHVSEALRAIGKLLETSNTEFLLDALAQTAKAVAVEDAKPSRRPSTIPPEALLRLAEVTGFGVRRRGENNWRLISLRDHLDHGVTHLLKWQCGETDDDHLGHALCRLAFAVATIPTGGWDFKEVRKINTPTN